MSPDRPRSPFARVEIRPRAARPRAWTASGLAILIVVAALLGCAPGARTLASDPGTAGGDAAVAAEGARDQVVTLPSGATLKAAAGWTVTQARDGVTLVDPDRRLTVEVVEADASAGMKDAVAAAWAHRRPGFDRQELAASDSPGREGWEGFYWARYRTSPAEARRVSAYAARKGAFAVVLLTDGPFATLQRRSSQFALLHDSLRPASHVPESYLGRPPRRLDAERVASLKDFIERIREAADVPGVSVVLFDREAVLIEQGFGVRECGRPEPATADSLYIIASNTKPLTTLVLARLVDEGRFDWGAAT